MPTKYHYNPATGKSGRCTASVKDCPLTSQYADGQVAHFETKKEYDAFGEKVLAAQYEFEMKRTLQRKEQEYATAKLNYDLLHSDNTLKSQHENSTETTRAQEEFDRINAEQSKNPMGFLPKSLEESAIKNSSAVIITHKPSDEVYDLISARQFFDTVKYCQYDDNAVATMPFEEARSNVSLWGDRHRTFANAGILNALTPDDTSVDAQGTGFLCDVAEEHHCFVGSDDDYNTTLEQYRVEYEKTNIFDTSTVPDKPFDTDVSTAVANNTFAKRGPKDYHRLLTHTREANDYAKKLTVHENNAIAFWTGSGSDCTGQAVYGGREQFFGGKKFDATAYVSMVNSAIHRSDASEKVVFRGVPYMGRDSIKDFMSHHAVGTEVTFKMPQSTTTDGYIGSRFAQSNIMYAIKSKTNAPVGTISAFGVVEEEYLIPSDVKYKVTGVTTKNIPAKGDTDEHNIQIIEMEEV